ncbi:MAG: hypothetical protein ACFFCS_05655 [Candidatus Hodarchaeota archaeon]
MAGKPKGVKMRVVPALIVIASFIWVLISYTILSEKETIVSSVAAYTESNTSIFFPSLPRINVFWFLPEYLQVIPLTLGQIVDFAIIITLLMNFQYALYPIFKNYNESKATSLDFELYRLEFNSHSGEARYTCKHEFILETLEDYDNFCTRVEARVIKHPKNSLVPSKCNLVHNLSMVVHRIKMKKNDRLLFSFSSFDNLSHIEGKPSTFLENPSNFDVLSSEVTELLEVHYNGV